jgi:quercetin dioxygenase-like cupin family protein
VAPARHHAPGPANPGRVQQRQPGQRPSALGPSPLKAAPGAPAKLVSVAVGLPGGGDAGTLGRMQKFSLDAIAREQAKRAAAAPSGRSAETVYGGHEHALRQTVLALSAGAALDEHESPGEATIQVLRGRVRLTAGQTVWDGRTGDLLIVPDARHALEAVEDSAILLTVSKATQASQADARP